MKLGKLIGLVALLLALQLFWRVRFVILLGFMAIALATILNRVVQRLTGFGLKRGLAITLTFVALSAVSILTLFWLLPPFIDQALQWLDQAPLELEQARGWLERIDNRVPPEVAAQLEKLDTLVQDIPRVIQGLFTNLLGLLRGALSLSLNALLVLVMTIMLLSNPRAYRRAFVALFPQFYRSRVQDILDLCEISLVAWGVGILFNMLVISVMSFIGLAIIGVPLPIGNAFIAGFLTFIPNIGPIVSVIPPMVLGLLEAPWKAVAVIALYIVIQQVESSFLTPLVMKRQVSLLPAAALLSQVICGILFGFIGVFLALPLIITGQVWIKELLIEDVMNLWFKPSPSFRRLTSVK